MITRRPVLALLLVAACSRPGPGPTAPRPEGTGALTGVVLDAASGKPLALVTVVAGSPALGGSEMSSTGRDGRYRVGHLPPGRYDLVFIRGSSQLPRKGVEIRAGATTEINAAMAPDDQAPLVITERAPTIDSGSTRTGTTIQQDYTARVPPGGRTWGGVLGQAAGSQGDALGTGFSGSTTIENSYGGSPVTDHRQAPDAFGALAAGAAFDEVWIVARADEASAAGATQASYGSGQMLAVPPGEKEQVLLPLEHTDVHARILGYVASVEVTQRFHNPWAVKIEAVYVFPLPANAAVADFVMTIGDRHIRGLVRDRAEAEKLYDEARGAGYTASLLTEERPNVFTQKVANIEPQKRIDVALTYYDALPFEDGAYSFAFPMVVGPRYNPAGTGGGVGAVARGARGVSGQPTEVSYLAPGEDSRHRLSMRIDLDAGAPLADVTSRSHAIHVEPVSERARRITLETGDVVPDKDFVLRYRLAGDDVRPAFFVNRDQAGEGTFTFVLTPPATKALAHRAPVEMVFVLDCSGSMAGAPLARAKQTIERTLATLGPADSFQIIRFSDHASALGAAPLPATPENLARGRAFLATLLSEGGTEMLQGVVAALDFPRDPQRLRIVSFLTDGYIGNEAQILGAVHDHLRDARLFSFGVGTSVNRFLLERMAVLGRGAAAFVDLGRASADEAVAGFYERMSHPVLADVALDWHGMTVSDVYPRRIPDLLAGRPVVISGRIKGPVGGSITVRGRVGGRPVAFEVPVAAGAVQDHPALTKLWARMRIADLADRATYEPAAPLVEAMRATALRHGILSPFTAFIAVDASRQTAGDHGVTVPVAVPVPQGVSYGTTVAH